MVGKNASADGSTMISYAADSYAFYGYLHFRPAADHQQGDVRKVVNWDDGKPLCEIPEVPHTYRVIGNMNEHQVTIGETTWGGRQLENAEGIDYGSLIYIALERSRTAREAINAVKAYKGNCGVWYSDGVYYVDKSHRVSTKREAMEIGRACNQISVLKWATMGLAYC
jgi:dipeptidase